MEKDDVLPISRTKDQSQLPNDVLAPKLLDSKEFPSEPRLTSKRTKGRSLSESIINDSNQQQLNQMDGISDFGREAFMSIKRSVQKARGLASTLKESLLKIEESLPKKAPKPVSSYSSSRFRSSIEGDDLDRASINTRRKNMSSRRSELSLRRSKGILEETSASINPIFENSLIINLDAVGNPSSLIPKAVLNEAFELIRMREFRFYRDNFETRLRQLQNSTLKDSMIDAYQNMTEKPRFTLAESEIKRQTIRIFDKVSFARPNPEDTMYYQPNNPPEQRVNIEDTFLFADQLQPPPTPHHRRTESSFAFWQFTGPDGVNTGISWEGDQKYAYFCYLMVFITFIILFAEIGVNGFQIENFSDNPTFGPSKQVLLNMGAKRADLILKGQSYRLIAAWFLHAGILHWLINMVALRNLGFSLEKEFGTPKIAIIYCWSGFAGVLTSCIFIPNIVGVGASGAIFGLFGASWADLIQNWGMYKTRKQHNIVLRQLIFGTIINTIFGLTPIIDQFAHLGGLFTGLFMSLYLLLQTRYNRQGVEKKFLTRHLVLRSFGLAISIVAPITMLIILYTNVNPRAHWCNWCEALNCVPIPSLWFCDASGCSDDSNTVRGVQYTNGTFVVDCPSYVGKVVSVNLTTKADYMDLINVCRALCFPP